MATEITKTLRQKTTVVQNRYRLAGSWSNAGTVSVNQRADATAVRHRAKPIPLTDTVMTIVELDGNPEQYHDPNPSSFYYREGYIDYIYALVKNVTIEYSDDGSEARNRALGKFTNRRGTFGESLVEARGTSNMLAKRGLQLVKAALALKRGDIKGLERVLDVPFSKGVKASLKAMSSTQRLGDGYLEVSFGVMPIVQNIQDAGRIYSEGLLKNGQSVRSSSGFQDRGPAPIARDDRRVPQGSAQFRGKVVNSQIANANAMGLWNIPLEVWNAVPFSFVFDWMGNVGTFLGALTGSAGLSLQGCQTSVTGKDIYKDGPDCTDLLRREKTSTRLPILYNLPVLPQNWTRESNLSFGKFVTLAALGRQIVAPGSKGRSSHFARAI